MRLLNDFFKNPIAYRLFAVSALGVLLPLVVLAMLLATTLHDRDAAAADRALADQTRAFAAALSARIDAADAVVAMLLARNAAGGSEGLRRAALDSGVFARLLVGDQDSGAMPFAALPPVIEETGSQQNGTLLLSAPAGGDVGNAYLVRRARVAGRNVTVYLEFSPQWLWGGSYPEREGSAEVLVVDSRNTTMHRTGAFPEHADAVVRAHIASHEQSGSADRVSWQAQRGEWRGAVVPLLVGSAVRTDMPWRVAGVAPAASRWLATASVWSAAGWALLGGLVAAFFATAWLARRYRWALIELRRGVLQMGTQRFTALPAEARIPELVELAAAVDDVGARLQEGIVALETLGEIDRLLLGATELEPVLDAILKRVTAVTHCQTVGIALLDTDSPSLGRVFVAADDARPLPVSRVTFDLDLLESLRAAEEGVTIARCEDERHSFLVPMRELGSEFFWVWPVVTGGRLAAALAVGFVEAPAPDPRFARYGTEFAERLAIALSKTARDEHLYRQAHFDPLTALPNRLLFKDRLTQELAVAVENEARGALLYIDLDHFKRVNDTVGHAAGDQLLQIVAQRLRACVKEGDTVARLAGDEFTVILRNVADPEYASLVAERIIESLKMPVHVAGSDNYVPASIGIALFPDDGTTIDMLMRRADGAMYRAKDLGRNRAVFYDRNLMANRFDTTDSGLYRALRRREFSLFYQPQFSLADGKLVGLEALLRWQTPRDGTRSPAEFIPAAETSGLIVDIGSWVFESACAQLALWREQGIAPGRLAINVSVQQLKYAEFPRNVRRILEKHRIPPEMIEIEMTESVFADEIAGAAMRQLVELGVRLALDDFGTGYSSLNYLRQHPIKVVKIDRTFLEDVPVNPASATLAETIITMAHALGKEVVAEGVETEEQMQFLRERRCDHAQGFYLARPMPVSQVTELLQVRSGVVEQAASQRQAG